MLKHPCNGEINIKEANMKKLIYSSALFAFTLGMFLFAGCEGDNDPGASGLDEYFANHPHVSDPRGNTENRISITPESEFVSAKGQQIAFTADGGTGPYQWDLAIPANGTISQSRNWRQGVYTATKVAENSVIVYDRSGFAALAEISVQDGGTEDLSITASATSLENDGDKTVVSATGGTEPYTWAVQDVALGNISSTSGSSVIYTRSNAGDNGVTVTDQNGDSASIVIQQP